MSGTGSRAEWRRLHAAAMRGVRLQSPLAIESTPPWRVADGPPATQLLRETVANHLWFTAGDRLVAALDLLPEASVRDAKPELREAAMRRLAGLISEGSSALVEEWLDLAVWSGAVLPPSWIPAVFQALKPAQRIAFRALFGARLRWLAAQDPQWALTATDSQVLGGAWATGSLAERLTALEHLRHSDPTRARELLESTWSTDSPEAREKLIVLLKISLTDADESFLILALEDRRKSIRAAAADLLAQLSRSAYVGRMIDRLSACFVLGPPSSGLLQRFKARQLTINPPESLDKAAQRDGIEAKPPAQLKLGERAFALMQMLSVVPPVEWTRRFDCSPAELLESAGRTDHADLVLSALSAAAARHPDAGWIEALSDAWRLKVRTPDLANAALAAIGALLEAIPADSRDSALQRELQALSRAGAAMEAVELLGKVPVGWSAETTRLAASLLTAESKRTSQQFAFPRNALESWGLRAEPHTGAAVFAALLAQLDASAPWHRAVERLNELVQFRTDMHKEFLL